MAQAMGKANARAPMDFIQMLDKLQRDCGGGELKMSDYGIRPEECRTLAQNTKDTMGGLFAAPLFPDAGRRREYFLLINFTPFEPTL